ncbi:phage tail spike protein [Caldifermentibacillus hisashii]|uniref:phage tail spike protein n=1 Tax=Caldifermentibacillus hisashii TaxID=996558 RepID=UPI003449B66F
MLTVYDKNLKPIGILENAFHVPVNRKANELWTASFSLPINDSKNELCSHFNYVEFVGASGRNYGLYRIMPKETRKTANIITYQCEHVMATLLDDVMDGYFQYTNLTTKEVLQAILDLQEVKHWVLGTVDFERYFHYSFENENGLLAPIFSIPKPFDEPYLFTFDTSVYPWKLNLIKASNDIKAEIRWGKDMLDFNEVADPTEIVNYIIPKGAGEGVNQLTIESVNGGKRYLKDDGSIDKWGVHKYIWIDSRFEDAESLKANAQSLLNQWKDPKISFECPSTDLSILPEYEQEKKVLYGVTRIIVDETEYEARIIGENIADILDKEYEVDYEINNKLDDIATTQTDVERKVQVNDAYSQGATNIMNFGYQDNCDSNIPAVIPFYIDDDVVNVNTCELTFRTKKFRAYSRATEGGGATVTSTESGGGTSATSSNGGGIAKSTESGGGSTTTSSANGTHRHKVFSLQGIYSGAIDDFGIGHYLAPRASDGTQVGAIFLGGAHGGDIYTQTADGTHSHTVAIPNHSHNFQIPNHTHTVQIPNHTHNIVLPNHTHEVKHEIIELDNTPSKVTIKVDGNVVPHTSTSGDRIDLIPFISKDSNGKIQRGRHEVEILPNSLARIEADLILRVFIRSKLGGVY